MNSILETTDKICNNIKQIETLSDAIVTGDYPTALPSIPQEIVETALNDDFNSDTELDVKKVVSAALLIAKKRNLLPEGVPQSVDGFSIASIADESFSRMKAAYQTATGNIDVYESMDILIDKATARTLAVSDVVVAKGVDVAINKLGTAVAQTYPQALPVLTVIKSFQPVITQKTQQLVKTGIKKINTIAKTAIRKIGNFVKEKLANKLKSLFA